MSQVSTDRAPAAIGPYSQAIRAHRFVFLSGQLGIDPKTGELVEGGVKAQTEQALQNLAVILEAADSSLDDVVKTTCYLADLADFDAFNEVYAKHFSLNPARECVQVAALPKGALVEVSGIALAPVEQLF